MYFKFIFFIYISIYAISVSANDVQEALSQYNPVGSSCDVEISKEKRNNAVKTTVISQCGIDAKDLHKRLNEDSIIVDVRNKALFETYRVTNSINVPLAEIQSKFYWKNKPIFIIGDGKSDTNLLSMCERLKKSGFNKTFVVIGGIDNLPEKEFNMIGNLPNSKQLLYISFLDVWRNSKNREILFLFPDSFPSSSFYKDFLNSQTISLINKDNIAIAIERAKEKDNFKSVVIIDNINFLTIQDISSLTERTNIPIKILNIDLTTFDKNKLQQEKILIAKELGPKKPKCG